MQAADLAPFSEHRMALVNIWAVAVCTLLFLAVAIGSCAASLCSLALAACISNMPKSCALAMAECLVKDTVTHPLTALAARVCDEVSRCQEDRVGCRYALFGDDVQADVLINLTLGHISSLARPVLVLTLSELGGF